MSGTDSSSCEQVSPLGAVSRAWRLIATAFVAVLLLGGTLWGDDQDFPLGPFRMYATRDDPNGVVRILEVRAVLADGSTRDVTNAAGAPRRAEMEGRIPQLRSDPALLSSLAPTYLAHVPDAVRLQVVWRLYPLRDGRSAAPTEQILASLEVAATP